MKTTEDSSYPMPRHRTAVVREFAAEHTSINALMALGWLMMGILVLIVTAPGA